MKVKCSKCKDIHHTNKRRLANEGIGLFVTRCPKCDYPGFNEVKECSFCGKLITKWKDVQNMATKQTDFVCLECHKEVSNVIKANLNSYENSN